MKRSLRKLVVGTLLATSVVFTSVAPTLAKVNEYEGQHRKVNEYEGQHRKNTVVEGRKVNEYEGQHRVDAELNRKVNEYEGQH